MSFSFEATGKPAAMREYVAKVYAPGSVKAFILVAIDGMTVGQEATETKAAIKPFLGDDDLIYVKAQGHLCEGPTWSAHTTAQIEVRPIKATV